MSKKRGKSATGSAHDSKWELALMSLPWNEDTWNGTIVMVSPNKLSDEANIACLSDAVSTGQRKLFTVVTQAEILHLVNDLGNPKAKKGKEVLPNFEICEVAKPYLDAGENIPWPLMAKLIKWKLLAIKADDVKRIELEKKGQDGGGKGGKKGADKGAKERGKSGKGKGGKKDPEPPSVKGDTKLRKRGEDDPDAKFIDDEPDDGSQKYIILLGFENAHLVKYMSHSGIPPDIILNFKKNSYSDAVTESENTPEEVEIKRSRQQNLDIYWRDLPLIFKECNKLSNTLVLDYFVSSMLLHDNIENAEKKMEFSMSIFEDVACMIYDILDNIRQWKDYNDSMKLVTIPLLEVTADDGGATTEHTMAVDDYSSRVDMRYYNDILSCLPEECITVELIVDSILEQIEATEQNKTPPSQKVSFTTDDGLNSEVAQHFGTLASKLALMDQELKKIEEEFHTGKKIKPSSRSPVLMHPLNSVLRRMENQETNEYMNVEKSEFKMISKIRPFSDFVQLLNATSSDLPHDRQARLQEFTHFLSQNQLSAPEIDRILKQFVFECMEITTCDVNGFISDRKALDLQDCLVIWDDPFLFFNGLKDAFEPTKDEFVESQTSFINPPSTPSDTSSRPNSGGILKKSKSPNLDRKSSVHFDSRVIEKSRDTTPPISARMNMSSVDVVDRFANLSARLLDEWCFAEFFDSQTLLQVIKNATHEKPFIDAYFNKRDQSIFLIVHNPQNQDLLSNRMQWQDWLHSNTGFRNYYSYIMENIAHWTVEREAIYKASQLGEEVKNTLKEDEHAAAQKEAAGNKRGRAKSPQKNAKSRSPNNSRPSSADKLIKNSEVYVMENSLKAQKLEAERVLKEQEEEERKKAEKRSKSAQKRAEKEVEKNVKDKRPGSDKSKKSSRSASGAPEVGLEDNKEEVSTPEPFWPFIGYDLEDKLAHFSGEITTMFPVDGGTIKSERTDYVNGSTAIRTCVLKDGHVFTVHIIDPVNEIINRYGENFVEPSIPSNVVEHENELVDKDDEFAASQMESTVIQASKPVSYFGSFTAVMKDGLSLALSAYGVDGKPDGIEPPIPKAYIVPVPQSSAGQEPAVNTSRGRKSKEKLSPPPPPVIEMEKTEDFDDKEIFDSEVMEAIKQDFLSLFVSCPSGQNISFFLESQLGSTPFSKMDRRLVVKIKPKQSSLANIPQTMQEVSRLITMDGIVIKTMKDGTSEILHPDGTVVTGKITHVANGALQQENASSQARFHTGKSKEESTSHKSGKSNKSVKNIDVNEDLNTTRIQWTTYLPSGEVICQGEVVSPLQMNMASDPSNGQIMYTREDKVTMVIWLDNSASITEHADGTRITQFALHQDLQSYRDVDVETGEKGESFTSIHEFSRIECPGLPTVLLNRTTGEAEVTLGGENSRNILVANSSGMYHLLHAEGGQVSIHDDGTVIYTPRNPPETAFLHPEGLPAYTLRHHADIVCEVVDPDGNVFSVDVSGNSNVMMASSTEEEHATSENKIKVTTGSPTRFKQHAPRFFVLHPDGSGMEYLRYQDVAEYLALAEKDPASAVVRSTFSDNYNASAITVLRPMSHVTDVWRVPYVQSSIVPNGLRSRDLKTIPPKEFKKPGPKFGTTAGRALSIGSALKNPQTPTPSSVPPIMEFRLLYQFKPIDENVRTLMKSSLLAYLEFMQKRVKDEFELQVDEPRFATEQDKANGLQHRCATDVQEMTRNVLEIYLKSTAPLPPPIPPSPIQKRKPEDWERDQREREEEINNRTALRTKMVPNYFLSAFGKDFLLEHAVDIDTLAKRLGVFPNSASNSRPVSGVDIKREEDSIKISETKRSETKNHEDSSVKTVECEKNISQALSVGVCKRTDFNEKKTPVYYKSNVAHVLSGSRNHDPPSSLKTNVIGEKRNNCVPIPSYLKSSRPGVTGNLRQFAVEDPVRRRVLTTSVIGGKAANQLNLRNMRGLNCLPSRIDFGLLREGYTFRVVLHLINTGVETCRWKVVTPPPATGLRLRYQPGPIAAGLRAELHVEIYAIAVGVEGGSGVGQVEHDLHITTETDTLIVPITARVMTAEIYDMQQNFGYARGVTLISTAPQNTRDFLIRLGRTSPIKSEQV